MNNNQKQELLLEIQREIFRRSFFEFVKWAAVLLEPNTNWKWNFHHEYICDLLQKETIRIKNGEPKTKNLIINVPFRSSKSHIVSVCYPIWSYIINPQMSFINLSYSDDLSTSHSNKVISILFNPKFKELYNLELDEVQRSKTDFKLKVGGQRLSAGITGTVLGRGSDVVILDDPNNSRKLSAVERKNTITAWKDTISTRLNDPEVGLFIVIQQRLHTNDLTGYLMENEPDNWDQIVLPAELTSKVKPAFLAEKYVDGLLWGNRFTREVLKNFKTVLGSVGYANQLLQEPVSAEGNIIKRSWIKTIPFEEFEEILINNKIQHPTYDLFLDTAYTKKQQNDPSAILVATKIKNIVYVRKVYEKWLEFPELLKFIHQVHGTFCDSKSKIYIELKASGEDVYNMLKHETAFNLGKLPTPKDDKETRLNAVSPLVESGRLVLIEDTSNDLIIDQLTGYPNVAHDDVMDTVVYSLLKYIKVQSINYLML